ncbi:Os09g0428500 [Oryza sativa Japonica Group]|uniref:Os09g0428500 protein n=2 Tax=Oryza sativa subsp. japonica TaxID=39947 RepID=B9G3Q0_ORYSJ|nr:hypothetical protein OsJ_29441 [Oryza sativa Japonica Group]KAB8110629.1 hypothetical protein EE612_047969 [Oryza sativa]KAB8110630.1 hypothetical protein EE612_047969 [Oryza sativa]BAT08191.1 Os09g0428500 [Oryza sativa Japonica Group]
MAARPTGRRRRGLAVVVSSNIALFAGGDEADDGPGFSGGRSNASLRRRAPRQGGSERGGARSPFDWECGNPRWRLVTRSPWLRPRLRLMEVASRERTSSTYLLMQPGSCYPWNP